MQMREVIGRRSGVQQGTVPAVLQGSLIRMPLCVCTSCQSHSLGSWKARVFVHGLCRAHGQITWEILITGGYLFP